MGAIRGTTHTALGVATAGGACAIAQPRPIVAACVIAAALSSSRWADRFEADDSMETGQHRKWTHWIATGLLTAAVCGVFVSFVVPVIVALTRKPRFYPRLLWGLTFLGALGGAIYLSLSRELEPYALYVGLGVACGYVMHLLADACTIRGAPLLGPFSKRDRHLLPKRLRVNTNGMSDRFVLAAAVAVIFLVARSVVPAS